jgi:hypothetical protein
MGAEGFLHSRKTTVVPWNLLEGFWVMNEGLDEEVVAQLTTDRSD